MSLPASALRPPFSSPPSVMEAPSEVTAVAGDTPAAKPLDFLLVISRSDFAHAHQLFSDEFRQAGMCTEIICIEDLPGATAGDKLTSLHQQNAARQMNGTITSSTIKIVLLHGAVGIPPVDNSINRFRAELGAGKTGVQTSAQSAGAAPPVHARIHMMTAAGSNFIFPTHLVDAALRVPGMIDDPSGAGFTNTIIYGACESGVFRDAAKETGGSYVFASGKKAMFTEDFNEGICAVIREQGQRKRQYLPPLSGRDCWDVMRHLSGEHVSFVEKDSVAVHKVLRSGHSAPALSVRADASSGVNQAASPKPGAQAIRTLFAKLEHGSAASVMQVIEKWGPGILSADRGGVMQGVSLWSIVVCSARDGEKKLRLLLSHAPGEILQKPALKTCLSTAIDGKWTGVLVDLFDRMTTAAPPLLSLEEFVIWSRSMEKQSTALIKLCRSNQHLSMAVGRYLAQQLSTVSDKSLSPYMSLPPFFDMLARKTPERQQPPLAQ